MPKVRFPKPLRKSFNKKDAKLQAALSRCFVQLRQNPFHNSLQSQKVKSKPGTWESKASLGDRVLWRWEKIDEKDEKIIVIESHCNHKLIDRL